MTSRDPVTPSLSQIKHNNTDLSELVKDVPQPDKEEVQYFLSKIVKHEAFGKPYQWSVSDFELGVALGKGKFGRVFCARERRTGHLVAIKTVFKSELVKNQVERQVLREIEIQSHLKHPHILSLHTWFHDERKIYLVLEFAANGELYNFLKKAPNQRFSDKCSAKYTNQIASALDYCHKNKVIHRDIKPENILVAGDGSLKLADFGWSVHAPSDRRKTVCGTLDYLPPEMVNRKVYDLGVDQWCLGILAYEFLVGKPPFESETTLQTYDRIVAINISYPEWITPLAKDFISRLLQFQSNNRMSLVNAMKHHWIRQYM